MIRWALAFVLSVLGASGWAQDITVRTGDHPSFTRIVFNPPAGTDWDLARVTDGYRLRVTAPAALNTARFFERIQRDRIAAIQPGQSDSELIIELACACFAEVFQWRPDQVVIDIKDPGSRMSDDALQVMDLRPRQVGQLSDGSGLRATDQARSNPVLADLPPPPVPEPAKTNRPLLELPLITTESEAPPDRQLAIGPLNQLLAQQALVGALENAITDSLGRALSQGLLDPGENEPATIESTPLEPDLAALVESVNAALTPGLVARTSVDRERVSATPQNQSSDGSACIPNALVDIPGWYSDIPFATLVGELRTKITGEFDRTDPAAIDDLAKAYITFGFGREAISTLAIDGTDSRSRQVMTTLAEIIDADPVTANDFHLQVGCPGHVALWGFLAHEDGPLPAQPDLNGIIVSFKLLPKDLRGHLAPRLAQKLNALGYHDFADDVLSAGDNTRIDVTTTQLEILTDRGATQEVTARLTELVDDNPRTPPDALVRLIELDLAAGKATDADRLTLLRTFQFETQDQDLLGKLYETEIRVMAAMDAFEAAQNLINTHETTLTADVADALRAEIYSQIAASAKDRDFLDVAFNPDLRIKNTDIQNTYAKRLLALGFPDRAKTFIRDDAVGDDMMERRYLRAEASMALGEIAQARAHLAGINNERARQILNDPAGVRVNTGAQVRPLGDNPENDPLLLSVAERVAETTAFQSNTETPLTDSRALVDQAAALRRDMAALIERYEIRQ